MTKIELAQVIVQALYNLRELPASNHPEVVQRARANKTDTLRRQYDLACKAIESTKTANSGTLGERLARQDAARKAAEVDAEHLERRRLDAKARARYEALVAFFEDTKLYVIAQIEQDLPVKNRRLPKSEDDQTVHIDNPRHACHDAWANFVRWADQNGLTATIRPNHDGGGIHGWSEVKIVPKGHK